ncbi:MAG: DUF1330 domain-containing protein [Pseudomonadota bacterium]
MNIDPTRPQFEAFKALPKDTPINMLNLVRLRQTAAYEDGRSATGAEAYATYGVSSGPIFAGVGGKIAWRGAPECVLIGPEDERWDIAFIARYPDAAAFLKMVMDPAYQAIVFHRQAAVEDSRLIRLGDLGGGPTFG